MVMIELEGMKTRQHAATSEGRRTGRAEPISQTSNEGQILCAYVLVKFRDTATMPGRRCFDGWKHDQLAGMRKHH